MAHGGGAGQARAVLGGRSGRAGSTLGTWPARNGIDAEGGGARAGKVGRTLAITAPMQQAAQWLAPGWDLAPSWDAVPSCGWAGVAEWTTLPSSWQRGAVDALVVCGVAIPDDNGFAVCSTLRSDAHGNMRAAATPWNGSASSNSQTSSERTMDFTCAF